MPCGAPSLLAQVTRVPRDTPTSAGPNVKFAIDTRPAAAAGPVVVGCTTTLRGALPTATVVVCPVCVSTSVTLLEPSLVTQTRRPSADVIQCGCAPTLMLFTGAFVAGSNSKSSPGPWTTTVPYFAPRKSAAMWGDAPVGISATTWAVGG